jgi:hypothetical protein
MKLVFIAIAFAMLAGACSHSTQPVKPTYVQPTM